MIERMHVHDIICDVFNMCLLCNLYACASFVYVLAL